MASSILDSTKKALGLSQDYDVFDSDVLMHINTVFSTLHQLGVGPTEPFMIEDATPTWDDFTPDPRYNMVRTYVYLRVRLLFDPPTTGFLVDALKQSIAEMEWRLNAIRENDLLPVVVTTIGDADACV